VSTVKAGGRTALDTLPPFEAIVSAHGAAVLRVCRGLVGADDADDVWQETFLAALRVYPTTAGVQNREAWLVTIARNKAVDHHRKLQRLPTPIDGTSAADGDVSGRDPLGGDAGQGGGDAVARSVVAGEAAAHVWAALAQLPPTQREAVVYHHLAGLRYAAVAELLGNSEAAARRAAADGMKTLRTVLAPVMRSDDHD
jgi:RNA polymerase sigma factor (sigma-70 family)